MFQIYRSLHFRSFIQYQMPNVMLKTNIDIVSSQIYFILEKRENNYRKKRNAPLQPIGDILEPIVGTATEPELETISDEITTSYVLTFQPS